MHSLAIPFRTVKGWQFWSDWKWRRNSVLSVMTWVIGTKIISHYTHWGPGWLVIIAVGLGADTATWGLKLLIVFTRRSITYRISIGRNAVVWLAFWSFNFVLLLLFNKAGGLSTMHTRYAMIPYGILINPVLFHVNNRVVFGDMSLPELRRIVWNRTEREATFAYLNVRGWTRTLY